MIRRRFLQVAWRLGERVGHRTRPRLVAVGSWLLSLVPLPAVDQWARNVAAVTAAAPTRRQRRELLASWLRNTLMSISLATWTRAEIQARAHISPAEEQRLHESLAGPGLILALPHLGSWDLAGSWAASVGIDVVSVAERLPGGMYESFRHARMAMGIAIYPVDHPDLLRRLADDVRAGRMVCLLADRDLGGRGLRVAWPTPDGEVPLPMPAGPALLARLTGADLRVATAAFDRGTDAVRLRVSDPMPGSTPAELSAALARQFAAAVQAEPTSWLVLQPWERGQ
ncbi:MAG: hypothetical protein ACK5KO_06345 [Arachnia sp.]